MCKILEYRYTKCWRPHDASPDYDEFAPENLCPGRGKVGAKAPLITQVCEKHEGGVPQYDIPLRNRKCRPTIEFLYIRGKCSFHGRDAQGKLDFYDEANTQIVRKPKLRIRTGQISSAPVLVDDHTFHVPQVPWMDVHYRMPNYNPTSPRTYPLDHDYVSPKDGTPSFSTGILNPDDEPEEWMDADLRPIDLLESHFDEIGDWPEGPYIAPTPPPTPPPVAPPRSPSFTESEMEALRAPAPLGDDGSNEASQPNGSGGGTQHSHGGSTNNQPQEPPNVNGSASGGAASQNNGSATGGAEPPPSPPRNPFAKFDGGYRSRRRSSSEHSSDSSSSDYRSGAAQRLAKPPGGLEQGVSGATTRTNVARNQVLDGPTQQPASGLDPLGAEHGHGSVYGLGITGHGDQIFGQDSWTTPPAPERPANDGTERTPSAQGSNATDSPPGGLGSDSDSDLRSSPGNDPLNVDLEDPAALEVVIAKAYRNLGYEIQRVLAIHRTCPGNRRIINAAMLQRLQDVDMIEANHEAVLQGIRDRLAADNAENYRADRDAASRQVAEDRERGESPTTTIGRDVHRTLHDRLNSDGTGMYLIEWGPHRRLDQPPWAWLQGDDVRMNQRTRTAWTEALEYGEALNERAVAVAEQLIDAFVANAEERSAILHELSRAEGLGDIERLEARSTWRGRTAYLVYRRDGARAYYSWVHRDGQGVQLQPSDWLPLWDAGQPYYGEDDEQIYTIRHQLQGQVRYMLHAAAQANGTNTQGRGNIGGRVALSAEVQEAVMDQLRDMLWQNGEQMMNRMALRATLTVANWDLQAVYDHWQTLGPPSRSIETDNVANDEGNGGRGGETGEAEIKQSPPQQQQKTKDPRRRPGSAPPAPIDLNTRAPPPRPGPPASTRARMEAMRIKRERENAERQRQDEDEIPDDKFFSDAATARAEAAAAAVQKQIQQQREAARELAAEAEKLRLAAEEARQQNFRDIQANPAAALARDRAIIQHQQRLRDQQRRQQLQGANGGNDEQDNNVPPHNNDDQEGAENGNPDPPNPRASKRRKLNNGTAAPPAQGHRPPTRSMGPPTQSHHHMKLRPRRRAHPPATAHVANANPSAAAANTSTSTRRGATNTRSGAGRGQTQRQGPAAGQTRGRGRPAITTKGKPRSKNGVQKKPQKKKTATTARSTGRTRAQTRSQAQSRATPPPSPPRAQANIQVVVPRVDPNWLATGRQDSPSTGGFDQSSDHSSDRSSDHGSPYGSHRGSDRGSDPDSGFIPVASYSSSDIGSPSNFNLRTGNESPNEQGSGWWDDRC